MVVVIAIAIAIFGWIGGGDSRGPLVTYLVVHFFFYRFETSVANIPFIFYNDFLKEIEFKFAHLLMILSDVRILDVPFISGSSF